MEDTARQQYVASQQRNGHPDITVGKCELFISELKNWLAATPDGMVHDPSDKSNPTGLLEVKCPFSIIDMDLNEAYKKSSFFLALNKTKTYCN